VLADIPPPDDWFEEDIADAVALLVVWEAPEAG
jgi:hypothetical protein